MISSCSLCSIDIHDLPESELEVLEVLSLGVDLTDMLTVSSSQWHVTVVVYMEGISPSRSCASHVSVTGTVWVQLISVS